eukprot:TRINITY_DN28420_c0_g1_i1.p1 TRINITY_DN28420_c0_g1~~TRINITY_DN28420_c0_g1_i1.p1  ORF type:complete len:214 (-),score=31.41 TRINITY_DN28420_c0_g1_i1:30-671(-)
MSLHEVLIGSRGSLSSRADMMIQSDIDTWMRWEEELVEEFRGNDQAGLALLVASYQTDWLSRLLGWDHCILCKRSSEAELNCFQGENPLKVRFRALPARILNHPEAMVNGDFPPGLMIAHLKGLWWRVALEKGVFGQTPSRQPPWMRSTAYAWSIAFETWQAGIPEHLRLQDTLSYTDEKGKDITDQVRGKRDAGNDRQAVKGVSGSWVASIT